MVYSERAARNAKILSDKMVAKCQPLVAGDQINAAFLCKKGLGSSPLVFISWLTQPLLMFQKFRIVASGKDKIYVFKSGWFTRTSPKELLATLPKQGAIQILDSSASKVRINNETWRTGQATGIIAIGIFKGYDTEPSQSKNEAEKTLA